MYKKKIFWGKEHIWEKKETVKIQALVKKIENISVLHVYIPSSEILEFPSVINFDIITSGDINFHFHFLS